MNLSLTYALICDLFIKEVEWLCLTAHTTTPCTVHTELPTATLINTQLWKAVETAVLTNGWVTDSELAAASTSAISNRVMGQNYVFRYQVTGRARMISRWLPLLPLLSASGPCSNCGSELESKQHSSRTERTRQRWKFESGEAAGIFEAKHRAKRCIERKGLPSLGQGQGKVLQGPRLKTIKRYYFIP